MTFISRLVAFVVDQLVAFNQFIYNLREKCFEVTSVSSDWSMSPPASPLIGHLSGRRMLRYQIQVQSRNGSWIRDWVGSNRSGHCQLHQRQQQGVCLNKTKYFRLRLTHEVAQSAESDLKESQKDENWELNSYWTDKNEQCDPFEVAETE